MLAAQHMLRIGRRGALFQYTMALRDLRLSISRLDLAWSLAWHDVVSRYRGSILGPFWITLSMGLMVGGIGLLYAQLFRIPVQEFIPYVALGIVFFGTITGVITEGCQTFIQAAGMLSQTAIPLFTFAWRTLLRNLIFLAHHLVIVVAVLIFYGYAGRANIPLALAGVLLLIVNTAWAGLLAGIVSARFRDIPQIVGSIMQFAVFMTPVFWRTDTFPDRHAVLVFNPFFHMLQAVRAPLLGQVPDGLTYAILAGMAVGGWAFTFAVFAKTRRRIVHYL